VKLFQVLQLGFFVLFLLSVKGYLYILETSPLSDIQIADKSCLSVAGLIFLLIVSSAKQKILTVMKFIIFSSTDHALTLAHPKVTKLSLLYVSERL
jgi:hypothetical protein